MKQLNRYLLICTTSVMVALSGCSEKEPLVEMEVSRIALSDSSVVAGPEGGEFSINVTSSGDWRVAGFCDWVTLVNEGGPSGENLTLKVEPNKGGTVRTAEFKVFSGDATVPLKITSNPTLFLELDGDKEIELPSSAGVFSVGIRTNCPDIEVSYSEGDEKWLEQIELVPDFVGKQMYKFSVSRSDVYRMRYGYIFFKRKGSDESVRVDISQKQLDTVMVLEGPRIVKGLDAVDFELNLKSNVSFIENFPSWIQVRQRSTVSWDPETGLTTTRFLLHCDATSDTRGKQVSFTRQVGYQTEILAKVVIKQQAPDPVYCTIPDKVLRESLIDQGWIVLDDETTGRCDILKKGLSGTDLVIEGNTYNTYDIRCFDGLESFPYLRTMKITSCMIKDIDLSKTRSLKQVSFLNCQEIRTCQLGKSNVEDLSIKVDDFGYQKEKEITVSGEHVKTFDFSSSSYFIGHYESCTSLDVTGMPELVSLKAVRTSPSFSGGLVPSPKFKTIYMTPLQKDKVRVEKDEGVSIEIK